MSNCMFEEEKLVIFHGSSGVGTSAMVNALIGEKICNSEYSTSLITSKRQYIQYNDCSVCDTPCRDKLKDVLHNVKIIFIITLESGRLTFGQINNIIRFLEKNPNMHYGIIVNHTTEIVKNNKEHIIEDIFNYIYSKKEDMHKMPVCFMDECDALKKDKINYHPDGYILKDFLQKVAYN